MINADSASIYNKLIVEQAPISIALLDVNMVYIAVSNKWLQDYKKEGEQIIGQCHYDVFPEIGDDWKKKHKECLNGAIDTCEEAPFKRLDGAIQWIFWDVRPWYKSTGSIGGLLMFTGDISKQRELRIESDRVKKILENTNKIAKIGSWELNLKTDEYIFNDIAKDIFKFPENTVLYGKDTFKYLKNSSEKNKLKKAIKTLFKSKENLDLELQFINYLGEDIWVRYMACGEFEEDICVKIHGCFQDITKSKIKNETVLQNNKRLYQAEKIAKIGYWRWSLLDNAIKWSPNLYSIMDINMEETKIDLNTILDITVPEDKNNFEQYLKNLNSKNSLKKELIHQIVTPKGKLKYILNLAEVIEDDNGQVIEVINTCQDITQQRIAELKFKGLLDSAPDAMIISDEKSNIQIVNQKAVELFGYKKEELFNKCVDILLPMRYLGHHHKNRKGYMHSPKSINLNERKDLYAIRKNGEEFPIQISLSPLKTEEGMLISAVIRDITKEIAAENDILEKNERLTYAENLAKFGYWQWDAIKSEYTCSEGLYEILEIDKSIKKISRDLHLSTIHPEDKEVLQEQMQNIRTTKMFKNALVYRIVTPKGKIKTVTSIGEVVKNEDDEIVLIKGTTQDITKQKEEENKILETNKNLELLTEKLTLQNEKLAEFAQITSHNLRAPVSNLNTLLDLYNISDSSTEKTVIFKNFEKVINHLTSTLNTLVTALKTKTQNTKREIVFFDDVVTKTKEILVSQISDNNVVIKDNFNVVSKLTYNKLYLESIFLNLVENSIKYRAEERTPEITIESKLVNNKVQLTFSDNGLGIDLNKHGDKIFGLNKVFHRHPDAKGVGLFITKAQIESMGGNISVQSEVNKGTTFTINF